MAERLEVRDLRAGYGEAVIVSGISLSLPRGKSLAVLGRNGTGKTTLINTLVGQTRMHGGEIRLDRRDMVPLMPFQRAGAGIGWVPQERNIFKSLTVEENLTAVARPGPWTVARVYGMFPVLASRRAVMGTLLSGGEQQMLAIARALVLNPSLLLLDEPLEGLAPIIVEELLRALQRVIRDGDTSAILVEQNPRLVLGMTDDVIVLDRGAIAHRGASAGLLADPATLDRLLGVAREGGSEPAGPRADHSIGSPA